MPSVPYTIILPSTACGCFDAKQYLVFGVPLKESGSFLRYVPTNSSPAFTPFQVPFFLGILTHIFCSISLSDLSFLLIFPLPITILFSPPDIQGVLKEPLQLFQLFLKQPA